MRNSFCGKDGSVALIGPAFAVEKSPFGNSEAVLQACPYPSNTAAALSAPHGGI